MNAYQILQIKTTATQDEIKKAFRTLAMKHHPDRGGNAEKFKEINRAYGEINTPEKQMRYDSVHNLGRLHSEPSTSSHSYSSRYNMTAKEMLEEMLRQSQRRPSKEFYYDGVSWKYGTPPKNYKHPFK